VGGLERADARVFTIDVRARRDLARKYGVVYVPTLAQVNRNGSVTRWTVGARA
jgi:hypothetical protein